MARAPTARLKLLDAAVALIRAKGYAATTVDDLCAAAGVTKGAFFYHFASKDDLAIAAAHHWSTCTGSLFASAPYHQPADPAERILAYIDFRKELLRGEVCDFTCLAGTMLQEVHTSHEAIRRACAASITDHAATLEADIAAAMAEHGVRHEFTPRSLALHTQAVLQGAFILAKAEGGPAVAAESVDHLKRYVTSLFKRND